MTYFTCMIVDDEPNAVKLLESYIGRFPELELCQICYDGIEAMSYLKHSKVDLIFLDINMPMLTGMELTALLPAQTKIIFTTAYSEYAVESYEKNAVDYLLKPITFSRFAMAIQKLAYPAPPQPSEPKASTSLFVKSGQELINIDFDEILFIKGEREYISIHTSERKLLIYERLKAIGEKLPNNFCRIHLSYIINLDKIEKVVQNKVLIQQQWLPISQSYRADFQAAIKGRMM